MTTLHTNNTMCTIANEKKLLKLARGMQLHLKFMDSMYCEQDEDVKNKIGAGVHFVKLIGKR